jgi:non-ribosomal peptide synthetase component F
MRIFWSLQREREPVLEPVTPYIDYIKWIGRQDREEGLRYWLNYLEGYNCKAVLPRLGGGEAGGGPRWQEYPLVLASGLSGGLQLLAGSLQVTLSTLFQACWGLLLQRYNNSDDVVFGAVVSGRPPGIDGIETMVGLFINTVPVRIRTAPGQEFHQLVQQAQQSSLKAKAYEYVSLADIQTQAPVKGELIDHILVFENYPAGERIKAAQRERETQFPVEQMTFRERTNYDFHVAVIPGDTLLVRFAFNPLTYGPGFIKKVAGHFREILEQAVENRRVKAKDIKISHDFLETVSTALVGDREEWI